MYKLDLGIMKQKISALDLQIIGIELKQCLEGYRLSNVYNIADSNKQFLLKFGKADSKLNLVIDCGSKLYMTDFSRPIPQQPSGFVVKLRKHLKSKRLTTVKQVKGDRILVFSFADGMFYLVLEFFSAGNIMLLDANRKILSLQRLVNGDTYEVGKTYEMFEDNFLSDVNIHIPEAISYSRDTVKEWFENTKTRLHSVDTALNKKDKVYSLHKLLFNHAPHLSSDLILEHLKANDINPTRSYLEFLDSIDVIIDLLNKIELEVHSLLKSECNFGFITAKKNIFYNPLEDPEDTEFIFEKFHPFMPVVKSIFEERKVIEIKGNYNKTLDIYFSTIDNSKYALRIQNQKQQAKKKIEKAKLDNQKQIQTLVDVQKSNEQKGYIIIENASMVDEARLAIQNLVNQQMDWASIHKLIKSEQSRNNKIANLIALPLDLKNNQFNVIFSPIKDEHTYSIDCIDTDSEPSLDLCDSMDLSDEVHISSQDSKNEKKKANNIIITIDLSLSAYANASNYFNIKKNSVEKQKKVEKNVQKAMKNIQQKVEKDLKNKLKDSQDVLTKIRKMYFFEKYNWFISNEGFLVLMAKNKLETDQLYSKYIDDNDIYVSNSFESHVWIKNPKNTEIPPNTLMQAGIFANASSEAWSKKILSSSWWTFAKNISKFDSIDGSVLPPGVFRLIDENMKDNLPPAQLVMGLALLWKVQIDENQYDSSNESIDSSAEEQELSISNETSENQTSVSYKNDIDKEKSNNVNKISENVKSLQLCNNYNKEIEDVKFTENPTSVITSGTKQVRGKKGKLKKIQRKYADQDDEERQLRLQLLGTLKGIEKEQQEKEQKLQRQQQREHIKQAREKQKVTHALNFTKKEKVKINYERIFNELKSTIDEHDTILNAIPVFAPWSALNKYKYKVKIQPGTSKKSKSANEILHYFQNRKVDTTESNNELDWPHEHEHIKFLKDKDLILLMCVDKLKISIPGTNNTNKSQKNKKPNSKRQK